MVFNSIEFLIFFPIVVSLYFLFPQKYRNIFLLVASIIFYAAFIPAYTLILLFLIIVDYFSAILIEKSEKHKKKFLILSILSTCLALFIFKYFNFFSTNLQDLANVIHWNYSMPLLQLALPIGLSFHTFQSLSYVIEVYKGKWKPEKNFIVYALYVMFFPQLVAGPIERPQHLLPQFHQQHNFDASRTINGLKIVIFGLFKKMVIADRLALFVNQVYGSPQNYHGAPLILAVIFFMLQVYYDFSGYSDMAIGIAQILGFNLVDNFDHPFAATSISDFWRRWHISLTTWFRDYVYIPLGGNRVSKLRWAFNIFVTFVISGLWHGANWTFIIWGALHGFYYIFGKFTQKFREGVAQLTNIYKFPRIQTGIKIFITFCLVCFAEIFFRANNLKDSFYIITHLFAGLPGIEVSKNHLFLNQPWYELAIAVAGLIFMLLIYVMQKNQNDRNLFTEKSLPLRWAFYYTIVFGILLFSVVTPMKFIYFQF
jgi:D-alanyl-lipoteichoic acid acyltransferase DltB (MBOAT superfamily)